MLESNYGLALCLGPIPGMSKGIIYVCQFCKDWCTIEFNNVAVDERESRGGRWGVGMENSHETMTTTETKALRRVSSNAIRKGKDRVKKDLERR